MEIIFMKIIILLTILTTFFANASSENTGFLFKINGGTLGCTASHLSGGLVFVTAGHCIKKNDPSPMYLYMGENPQAESINKDDVYEVRKAFKYPFSVNEKNWHQGDDIAFILLKRKVPNLSDATRSSIKIKSGSTLEAYGYRGAKKKERKVISSKDYYKSVFEVTCRNCGHGDSGMGVYFNGQILGVYSVIFKNKHYIAPIEQNHIDWFTRQLGAYLQL